MTRRWTTARCGGYIRVRVRVKVRVRVRVKGGGNFWWSAVKKNV